MRRYTCVPWSLRMLGPAEATLSRSGTRVLLQLLGSILASRIDAEGEGRDMECIRRGSAATRRTGHYTAGWATPALHSMSPPVHRPLDERLHPKGTRPCLSRRHHRPGRTLIRALPPQQRRRVTWFVERSVAVDRRTSTTGSHASSRFSGKLPAPSHGRSAPRGGLTKSPSGSI